MSLQFFIDRFDSDNSTSINVAEFESYLVTLRGDDEEHCSTAAEIFAEANVINGEASGAELEAALALSTGCVIDVYCGIEFEVEVDGEEFICGEHDHEEEGGRKLQHDHEHGDEDSLNHCW